MTVSGNFYKVTFQGALDSGAQSWSTSFYVQNPASMSPGSAAAFASGIKSVIDGNLLTPLSNCLSSIDTIDGYTVRCYSPNSGVLVDEFFQSDSASGGGGASNATQTALVVSMRTAGFGRAYRGRMYVPATGLVGAGERAPGTPVSALATGFQAVFNGINAISDVTVVLLSLSRSAYTPITSIDIDNVFDTQRRRRDKVTATATVTKTIS